MRLVTAFLCLTAILFTPLLRQAGAASAIARVVETASPLEADDDLERPAEELNDGEETALRSPTRRDLLGDPRTARFSSVRVFPEDLAPPPSSYTPPSVSDLNRAGPLWPTDDSGARHAWLQVFLF